MCDFSIYQKLSKKVAISLRVWITFLVFFSWGNAVPVVFSQPEVDAQLESGNVGTASDAPRNENTRRINPKNINVFKVLVEDYHGTALSYPSRIFVDSVKREVYVTDSGNGRILVFTHDLYPLLSIGKNSIVEAPVGVAVDKAGYLFVAQSAGKEHPNPRISVFDPALRWKRDISFTGFPGSDGFTPKNLAVSRKGDLYVAGNGLAGGVVILDREGEFSHFLIPSDRLGKGEEEQATVCDVTIDSQGNIYLLSEDMGRIYVYDGTEGFVRKFGKKGGSTGKLSRPRGLAVDEEHKRVYVIDYMRHTASAYSEMGQFLFEFGGKGWSKGWFQFPGDIEVNTSGNILVADTFNNRVQVFRAE